MDENSQEVRTTIIAQILQGIRHLSDNHVTLLSSQKDLEKKFDAHIAKEELQLNELAKRLDDIDHAFPNADGAGHRMYHETIIKALEQKMAWRQAVIEKTTAALIWSALAAVGAAMWHYLKENILQR